MTIASDSLAETTGKESFACALGIDSKARASLGSWIVLAEWKQDSNYDWHIKDVVTAQIDGKKLKADTFYRLSKGRIVKAK
jgi:hypothetical protein